MLKSFILWSLTLLFVSILGLGVGSLYFLEKWGLFTLTDNNLKKVLEWKPSDNTLIFDRDGNKIAELYSDDHIYYPFEKIPKALVQSIVAIEDGNFWKHAGVDIKAIARAGLKYVENFQNGPKQGGSTITQQVIRHFLLTKEKTIPRKVMEIVLALRLEQLMPKEKIFEIYANTMFLGSGAYGVGSASKRFFAKNLEDLKFHEFALIAGLFQSPSLFNPHKYPDRAKARQEQVLQALVDKGAIDTEKKSKFATKDLTFQPYKASFGEIAPYFVDFIREEVKKNLGRAPSNNEGLRIYTTLNPRLQKLAEKTIEKSSGLLNKFEAYMVPSRGRMGLEAALIATNPKSGEILSMVGGRNYKRSQFNRTSQAMRQPGSGFKPAIYSLALSRGFKWSDVLYVAPMTLAGNYRPKTSQDEYLTETTLLRAFYKSLNGPALELGQKLGVGDVLDHAKLLGIRTPIKHEFGSLLGASEVTMMDMARMFSVFANDGRLTELMGVMRIEDGAGKVLYKAPDVSERSKKVLGSEVAFLMLQGMRDVLLRGTGTLASDLSKWAVGKTGTTNESKDNWFNGLTSDLVSIIWVGSDDQKTVGGNAQGGVLALPIWADFMRQVIKDHEPKPFHQPKGMKRLSVDPRKGYIARDTGVSMWFLENALPPEAPAKAFPQGGSRDPFGGDNAQKNLPKDKHL